MLTACLLHAYAHRPWNKIAMIDHADHEKKEVKLIRLSIEADAAVREHTSRRGDLSNQINHAILGTDLSSLEVRQRSRAPGSRQQYVPTAVTFEVGVYEKVKEAAESRNLSATSLIDAAIIHFFGSNKSHKEVHK